jgi:ribonuclease D
MSSATPDRFASFPERYIDTQDAFEAYVSMILDHGDLEACSIDTEADSMHSYETKLCLIQFSTPTELAIIDPLSIGIDGLKAFPDFIDRFEKVWMHGADYDISMFSMTFDWAPHRIMDTQIAARLLGET